MDIRQLKYFLAIAKEGQITRAAKLLNMEQPPLSRQLKQMEDELGVQLFERTRVKLRLTEAGVMFKQKAQLIVDQLDEMVTEVKEIEEGVRGTLSIGSVVSCISHLPQKMKQFIKSFPQVTFKISEGDHHYLGELLEKRDIEMVLARLPFEATSHSQKYNILKLPSDPFIIVIPSSWALFAAKNSIHLREAAEFPFLTLKTNKTIQMHEQFVAECKRHGFEPSIICECTSVAIIIALIAQGIGATVFPKSVMSSFPIHAVKMLEIEDAELNSDVGIVWLKERFLSKSAQYFIDSFRAV